MYSCYKSYGILQSLELMVSHLNITNWEYNIIWHVKAIAIFVKSVHKNHNLLIYNKLYLV